MEKIAFIGTFGEAKYQVEISDVAGGNGSMHVMVDNRFWGAMLMYQGQWECRLHRPPGWLTKADLDVLCELVEAAQ